MKYIYINICMQHAYICIEKHIHTNFIAYGHMICLTYQLLDCATLFRIPAKKDMQTDPHAIVGQCSERAVIGMQTVDQQ